MYHGHDPPLQHDFYHYGGGEEGDNDGIILSTAQLDCRLLPGELIIAHIARQHVLQASWIILKVALFSEEEEEEEAEEEEEEAEEEEEEEEGGETRGGLERAGGNELNEYRIRTRQQQ
ncbi:hypothetical protein NGA_0402600, partial [Nannochloropsis gaditana CCMP526]|uniref:uncharacterized protein n=1 Tax=Nannochloropsis gaditana (strain CCMP526) TaxID=1093141 RepID=UPI00029F5351